MARRATPAWVKRYREERGEDPPGWERRGLRDLIPRSTPESRKRGRNFWGEMAESAYRGAAILVAVVLVVLVLVIWFGH